jgi:hypothetical protein
MNWKDILSQPCYLLSMKSCAERYKTSYQRVKRAGFTNILRANAIDASTEDLTPYWESHGSPLFDPGDDQFLLNKGKQACALGHYTIWRDIIQKQHPYAVIMEDDVQFHKQWKQLAPYYWDHTPNYFDILFMGSQFNGGSEDLVVAAPCYCTHAYVITFHGACLLYDLCLLQHPTRTIDCILYDDLADKGEDCLWQSFCWNGKLYPDKNATKDPILKKRNCGLVFQDAKFQSLIEEDTCP